MEISLQQLSEIFEDVFNEQVIINNSTTKDDLEQWDSLNHLNLIVEIEDKFDVSFKTNEIEEMKSVKDILRILRTK